ncbi:MAG: hypothetical protein GXO48_04905 [Chlorobi bacterium]|nr:hypothetical protein [Chlorobiota bacterium]
MNGRWLLITFAWASAQAQQSPWWITETSSLEIPIVVHVLRDTFSIVPSDIYNWLDTLNKVYNSLDTTNLFPWEQSVASIPSIRFAPARRDEFGNPIYLPVAIHGSSLRDFSLQEVASSASGGVDPISPKHILNIWIARLDTPFGIVPNNLGFAIDYRYLNNFSIPLALLSLLNQAKPPLSELCEGLDSTTCSFEGDGICDISPVASVDSCGFGTDCDETPPFHNVLLLPDSSCPWFISHQQVLKLKQNIAGRNKNWITAQRQSFPFDNLILRGLNVKSLFPPDSIELQLLVEWNTNLTSPPDSLFISLQSTQFAIYDTIITSLNDGLNTVFLIYSIPDTGILNIQLSVFGNRPDPDSTDNHLSFPLYIQSQPFAMPWQWDGTLQTVHLLQSWNPDFQNGWTPFFILPDRDSSITGGWMMPFFDYECRTCSDWLYTPWFAETSRPIYISLTYAYTKYDPYHADSLALWLEIENRGRVKIWQSGGRELQTTELDRTQWWEPSNPLNWETICVSTFPQPGNFRIVLEAKSDYGNNLFINSIVVTQDSCPQLPTVVSKPGFQNKCFRLINNSLLIFCPVVIYDLAGKELFRSNTSNKIFRVKLPSETYLIRSVETGKTVKLNVP